MRSAAPLLTLSHRLHGVTSLEDVVERALEVIRDHTRYRRAYVHLYTPDRFGMEIVGYPLPDMPLVRQRLATVDVAKDRLLQRAFSATEPFVVADLREDPDADQALVAHFGNRTVVCVPMFEGDAQIGPFVVATYADEGVLVPTPDELAFIVSVGSLVAVVIGRLRAEDARRDAEERLARDERASALGRMAGAVAHDFNNILLAVMANAELAGEQLGAGHPVARMLVDIQEAAERAASLSRQLLQTARGQLVERRRVAVADLLATVERLMRPVSAVPLEIEVHPGATHVDVDPVQLERVITNLLLNARDAGARRVTIDVALLVVDDDVVGPATVPRGAWVVFAVSDDGAGMPPAVQARAFEPYFTTRSTRGTGLGLAVVDGIVRQHGGLVHVDSEPGQGTTFRVYLPASVDAPALPAIAEPTRRTGDERVLVVDDDPDVRRAVARVLATAGYPVVCAGTAAEALQHEVALVLTDVVLGEDDGIALARALHAKDPAPAVILMSGYARGRRNELGLPMLTKPFTGRALLGLVRASLDRVAPPTNAGGDPAPSLEG